ncbi:hypothetical protein 268TH004_61 [Bacillus phage 268TH004]|uniref:Uncharacterized protein n=1 Tax=Bacillus phage 268TH004 TaxID=2801523 RepID=A0A7T7ZAM4_9CAUD|nr:hypothetical protein 268TH004_61 [Bacillus phage 268TH004]
MMTALTILIWVILGIVVVSFTVWVASLVITLIGIHKMKKKVDSEFEEVGIFTPRISKKFRK